MDEEDNEYFGVKLPSLPLGFELSAEDAFALRSTLWVCSHWFVMKNLIRNKFGSKTADNPGADMFFMIIAGLDVDDDNKVHFNTQNVFNSALWWILPGVIYRVVEEAKNRLPSKKKGGGIHSELLVEEVSTDKGMPIPNGSILYSVNGPDNAIRKLLKHFVPHANMDAMVNELIDKMVQYDNYEEFIIKEKDFIHTFATKLTTHANINKSNGKRIQLRNRSTRSTRSPSRRRTRSTRF